MAAVTPYLHFNGNCEEVFNFYRSVFGTEFEMMMRYKDAPPGDHSSPADAEKVMHASLPIGRGTYILGSDVPSTFEAKAGNNSFISIDADSREEADKIYNGLSAGGQVMMPIADTFWGAYFGMFADKYGTQWMVSYNAQK